VQVPAGVSVPVRLEHPGYRTWTDHVSGEPGQVVRIRAPLVAARATLHVASDPSHASVTLSGKLIGETPLDRDDLDPAKGVELVIAKAGFESERRKVDLAVEQPVKVDVTLRAVERFGAIDLFIDQGWADVYLKGKKVGRAPVQGLRLPVGHQRLRLVNPPSGKQTWLDVDVSDTDTHYYRTRFQ
jgi:hypothetical protein